MVRGNLLLLDLDDEELDDLGSRPHYIISGSMRTLTAPMPTFAVTCGKSIFPTSPFVGSGGGRQTVARVCI